MSSILDLKTRLQSKLQSDQQEAEKLTQSALQQHESNLNELLNDELLLIKSATESHRIALENLIQEARQNQAKVQKNMLIVSAAPLLVSLILVGLAFLPVFQKPKIYYQPMITMDEPHMIQKMDDGKTYKLMTDKPLKTCIHEGKKVMCWEIK